VPLLPPSGGSLTACAKGEYHRRWVEFAHYLRADAASTVVDLGADDETRLSEPVAHAACYRRVAQTLRSAAPGVRLQWTAPQGRSTLEPDPLAAWPGRQWVDVVGVRAFHTGDDWRRTVHGERGLDWWADFAAGQRRELALARWGVVPGASEDATNAAYVQNMRDWLVRVASKQAVAYDLYTEPLGGAGEAATRTYRELF